MRAIRQYRPHGGLQQRAPTAGSNSGLQQRAPTAGSNSELQQRAPTADSYNSLPQLQHAANCPSFSSPQFVQRQLSVGLSSCAEPSISCFARS